MAVYDILAGKRKITADVTAIFLETRNSSIKEGGACSNPCGFGIVMVELEHGMLAVVYYMGRSTL